MNAIFRWFQNFWRRSRPYRGKRIPESLLRAKDSLGKRGERLAGWYLSEVLGLELVAQNAYAHVSPINHRIAGEMDFIMREKNGGTLVFVEVRTLAHVSEKFGTPVDSVDHRKRVKVCRAARLWMKQNRISVFEPARFDIVSIVWPSEGNPQIDHFPAAFPWTDPAWRKKV